MGAGLLGRRQRAGEWCREHQEGRAGQKTGQKRMQTECSEGRRGNGAKERAGREGGKGSTVRGVCRRAEKKEMVSVAGAKHVAARLLYPEAQERQRR